MEITGRIVTDAKVSIAKGDREVVNFTVVINDRYRPKGTTETKEFSTFYNIAWWMGKGIAKVLTKGSIVTVTGRLFTNAYLDLQGNPKASINCHASEIKLIHIKKSAETIQPEPHKLTEPIDDLPF